MLQTLLHLIHTGFYIVRDSIWFPLTQASNGIPFIRISAHWLGKDCQSHLVLLCQIFGTHSNTPSLWDPWCSLLSHHSTFFPLSPNEATVPGGRISSLRLTRKLKLRCRPKPVQPLSQCLNHLYNIAVYFLVCPMFWSSPTREATEKEERKAEQILTFGVGGGIYNSIILFSVSSNPGNILILQLKEPQFRKVIEFICRIL